MFPGLKEQWRRLREDPPGQRFRKRYERRKSERRSPFMRVAWTVVALLLIVAGIAGIPLPGPGIVLIAVGLAVLAEESRVIAKLCDRIEVAIRRLIPGVRKTPVKSEKH
jgi:hypothetical protein